jgi:hypothetical protein
MTMTEEARSPLLRAVTEHRGAFVASLVVGAVLMLGVRSLFVDADGAPAMAQAGPGPKTGTKTGPGTEHHAEPGHEGHAHGDPVAAPAPADEDGHGSHGKKKDADEHGGHEAGGDEESDEKKQDHDGHDVDEAKHVPVLLDLGNASCPVMGGDADGKTFTEWNGLRVGHCCPGCKDDFLENPESLLDEVSPKWRDVAAAAKAIDAAEGDERKALLEKAAKSWTVVRQPVGTAPKEPAGLLIELGNDACPVMGGDVNGKTFTEWKGLRVGHCCPGCTKRFLANPEALLDEVAPEWRAALADVEAVNDAQGAAREKALAALRRNWKVVREPAFAERTE